MYLKNGNAIIKKIKRPPVSFKQIILKYTKFSISTPEN